MPASEAPIRSNQANALRSTEGKAQSRANALKHGLTSAGVVLPEADALEVERRTAAFALETNAQGAIGLALARLAALNSVRLERGADQQTAALAERVRQVEAEFVAPEGVDEAQAEQLRAEATRRAMFDPSPEAEKARRYQAAAERTFLRCLKDLEKRKRAAQIEAKAQARTQVSAPAPVPVPVPVPAPAPAPSKKLGSFGNVSMAAPLTEAEIEEMYRLRNIPMLKPLLPGSFLGTSPGGNVLPISSTGP